MVHTTRVYSLKKEYLTSYLEEFGLTFGGTVDEQRKRLAAFIIEAGKKHEPRLIELEIRHARVPSPLPEETQRNISDANAGTELPSSPKFWRAADNTQSNEDKKDIPTGVQSRSIPGIPRDNGYNGSTTDATYFNLADSKRATKTTYSSKCKWRFSDEVPAVHVRECTNTPTNIRYGNRADHKRPTDTH